MKVFLLCVLLLLGFQTAAQDKLIETLDALHNQIAKEKVFIHSNKTSYHTDDTIWFKAYVGDTLNQPSIRTTKLYVNLINSAGMPVYKKVLFIEKGIGYGQFELDDTVAPGDYYIQAYTNYMRNFGDHYHYLSEVSILGKEIQPQRTTAEIVYDIQLLPEGGYLLEGIKNTMGIKALINGRSFDFKGNILNDQGESVAAFKSEHLGMTKCEFSYQNGKTYTVSIILNDTIIKRQVPRAHKKGMAFHIDATSNENYVNIVLRTNEATFKNKDYADYSLLTHQEHQIFDLISLTRFDSLTGIIKVNKGNFRHGVNAVTLFQKDTPIAERKFFVEKKEKQLKAAIERMGMENDSLSYQLKIKNQNNPTITNLSISVLPETSKALSEKQNILSAFLLTPFVKGFIENPAYYFNSQNQKRKEHLDLLLLTQGWTQYSLQDVIQNLDSVPKFKFELGFELKGKVTTAVPYDSISLIRNNYLTFNQVALKKEGSFSFENLLLYKGDTTKVSFIDTTGKLIAPKKIDYKEHVESDIPHPKIPKDVNANSFSKRIQENLIPNKEPLTQTEKDNNELLVEEGTIILEEATIKEKKRSQAYLARRKVIKKYKPVVSDIGRYYDIPVPELFLKYNYDLLNYFEAQGIRVVDDNPLDIHYVNAGSREVIVVVDGQLLPPEQLSGFPLRMKEVENILVSNSGNIEGQLVSGEIYQVFSKKKFGGQLQALFNQHRLQYGYDRHKKYYTPFYVSDPSMNTEYLDLYWKPNLNTNKNGMVIFKIPKNRKTSGLLFSVQGFSNKGHLISQTIRSD